MDPVPAFETSLPVPTPSNQAQRLHLVPLGGGNLQQYYLQNGLTLPEKGTTRQQCRVEIFPGLFMVADAVGYDIFVGNIEDCNPTYKDNNWNMWLQGHIPKVDVEEPFILVKVTSPAAYKKTILVRENVSGSYYRTDFREVEKESLYEVGNSYSNRTYKPYLHVQVEVSTLDGTVVQTGEFRFKEPRVGTPTLNEQTGQIKVAGEFFKYPYSYTLNLRDEGDSRYGGHSAFLNLQFCLTQCNLSESEKLRYWECYLRLNQPAKIDNTKISATENKKDILPNVTRLGNEDPVLFAFYEWLKDGKTRNKGCNNTLLAAFLKACGKDFTQLRDGLKEVLKAAEKQKLSYYNPSRSYGVYVVDTRPLCLLLPGAKERHETQEASADWSKRKNKASQADGLGIDQALQPLLYENVANGSIPTTVFRQPDKTPVNREFKVWEKALSRPGWAKPITEIAASAASRSTYEKDITPYLSFLFRLEKYLERNTGKPWTCMPKFVSAQWELEMDEPGETGTTKRRSAFTPVADNETNIVTVPYVAVCVSGVRTQWCYSRFYHVFEENMIDPESGGVVESDLTEKLNGRDDYGLMYFTLTGTVTARGYPTFLVIFERIPERVAQGAKSPDCPKCNGKRVRSQKQMELFSNCAYCTPQKTGGTRVHFHRTHPCRKRGEEGGKTLACELVAECYRYMAGNVRAEEITAQQGDLIFIRCDKDPREKGSKVGDVQEVNEFESHRFVYYHGSDGRNDKSDPLPLYPSKGGPKNRLGFLYAKTAFSVRHPEHENIHKLEEGWWEVRRCKSWEANPHAIWSLTID